MTSADTATKAAQVAPPFRRAETAWHAGWKASFAEHGCQVERPHRRISMQHRADITLASGCVIEVQRGWLAEDEARRRELSYRKLAWILDGTNLGARWHVGDWGAWVKSGPRWWATLRAPRFVDLGVDGVAEVTSLALVEHKRGARMLCRYRQTTRDAFVAWAVATL